MPFYLEAAVRTLVPPDTPRLVEPWLTAGGAALVFGAPSAGKTLWAATFARALATGGMLFGTYPCTRTRVLIVQADMPTETVVERAQASVAEPSPNIGYWLTDNAPLDVLRIAAEHRVTLAEARAFAPGVLVIDTLRKTHNLDENDSAAPDRIYGAWRALFPGAALVFLHHARKVPAGPAPADAVVREAFRGSIAWAASADTIVSIRRVRRRGLADWLVQMRFVRTRGCSEPPPLTLRLGPDLTLAPTETSLEASLMQWVGTHARATRRDAVQWLQTLTDAKGRALCGERRAYRVYDRVAEMLKD